MLAKNIPSQFPALGSDPVGHMGPSFPCIFLEVPQEFLHAIWFRNYVSSLPTPKSKFTSPMSQSFWAFLSPNLSEKIHLCLDPWIINWQQLYFSPPKPYTENMLWHEPKYENFQEKGKNIYNPLNPFFINRADPRIHCRFQLSHTLPTFQVEKSR